jgi:hypothetical protein
LWLILAVNDKLPVKRPLENVTVEPNALKMELVDVDEEDSVACRLSGRSSNIFSPSIHNPQLIEKGGIGIPQNELRQSHE